MPLIESARSLEIRRRDILAAAAVGLAFGKHCPAASNSPIRWYQNDPGPRSIYQWRELEIVLKSGARKTFRVEYHRGHYKNPMTDAEMEEKFRLLAQKHLSADRVDALVRRLWRIESEPQVSGLITATQI